MFQIELQKHQNIIITNTVINVVASIYDSIYTIILTPWLDVWYFMILLLLHAGTPRKSGPGQLTESNIWSYVIQLSSALRNIHSLKLAVHCLVSMMTYFT